VPRARSGNVQATGVVVGVGEEEIGRRDAPSVYPFAGLEYPPKSRAVMTPALREVEAINDAVRIARGGPESADVVWTWWCETYARDRARV